MRVAPAPNRAIFEASHRWLDGGDVSVIELDHGRPGAVGLADHLDAEAIDRLTPGRQPEEDPTEGGPGPSAGGLIDDGNKLETRLQTEAGKSTRFSFFM